MATRNRYVRVSLSERVPTNLLGGIVESQHDDHLLIQRPDPKPRARKAATTPRKPRKTQPATLSAAVAGTGE